MSAALPRQTVPLSRGLAHRYHACVDEILNRLRGASLRPLYMPDLTLWYAWHSGRGTLPAAWRADSLAAVCRRMGVPAWCPARPWRLETPGLEVQTVEQAGERTVRWQAPSGTLQARWTLGPDGDWWQAEYPVKSAADLPSAAQIVAARVYRLEPERLDAARRETGESGPVVAELPMRPYSELLHVFLGWSEGFMLLFEAPERIAGLLTTLESKLQGLVRELAGLPADVVLSPDNLDGQFITPPAFAEHLLPSYRATARTLAGRLLAVHAGGMVRGLLPGLAEAGVDLIQGVCGPPQSDAGLAEARAVCGEKVALWGGIAQDLLLAGTEEKEFDRACREAFTAAGSDPRIVVGVADKVPVDALPERLEALSGMSTK